MKTTGCAMTRRFDALAVLLLTLASASVHAGAPANSCSDPYWQNTLRCQMLAVLNPMPMPPPQPVPNPPATVNQIRDFTRVDLPDLDVRCVDGTRPILFIDKAVGAPSNRWIITMTGGEFCAAQDLDQNGSHESGQECLDDYIAQHGALMGSAGQPAMTALTDQFGNIGIQSADPTRNPMFAGYHRVRVHKCGFDRHSGRATHPGVSATLPMGGPTINYDLYNHGQKIVLAALEMLRGPNDAGLSYPTWVNVGGVVTTTTESLPSITAAEQVVLIGHSAAAHGLYQNADRYAAALRAMPGFSGDVRAVHDAQFQSAVENEAAFDPAQNPDPQVHNTLFDQRTSGTTLAAGAYDSYRYHGHPNSPLVRDYRAWLEAPGASLATVLDASCVAAHTASNDAWKCSDRFHVRLHHESTPALLREDYFDPNSDHINEPYGYILWWGELAVYLHCNGLVDAGVPDLFAFSPCPPTATRAQSTLRLAVQATHFRLGVHTLAENVVNADPTDDPGSVFVWMPSCGSHEGAYDDPQYYDTSVWKDGVLKSYREFLQDFVAAPATGVIEYRASFLDGAISECAPLLLRDGFD
jgi:hypothetical protein